MVVVGVVAAIVVIVFCMLLPLVSRRASSTSYSRMGRSRRRAVPGARAGKSTGVDMGVEVGARVWVE